MKYIVESTVSPGKMMVCGPVRGRENALAAGGSGALGNVGVEGRGDRTSDHADRLVIDAIAMNRMKKTALGFGQRALGAGGEGENQDKGCTHCGSWRDFRGFGQGRGAKRVSAKRMAKCMAGVWQAVWLDVPARPVQHGGKPEAKMKRAAIILAGLAFGLGLALAACTPEAPVSMGKVRLRPLLRGLPRGGRHR